MPDREFEAHLEELFSDTQVPDPIPDAGDEPPAETTALPEGQPEFQADGSDTAEAPSPETASELASELHAWRTRVLNILLSMVAIIALPVLYFTAKDTLPEPGQWPALLAFVAAYLVLLGLAFLRRLAFRLRAWGLIFVAYVVGGLSLARGGLAGDGTLYLLVLPAFALILIGARAGLFSVLLSLLIFAAFALIAHLGWLENWLIRSENPLELSVWLNKGSVLVMLLAGLMGIQWFFNRYLLNTLQEARHAAVELGQTHDLLQRRSLELEEANLMLVERARALDASAQVSRATSSLLETEALIRQTVRLINEHFDYYYVGLFLLDAEGRWAELKAGTGEAGRQMLAQAHKLEVGSDSMIGWCTAHGQARIALDVGAESVRFENPLLPETRSEMALPLISRGRVIGALTVQSTEPQAFSDEDIAVLQTMADQVANAIENARLLQETERLALRSRLISEVTDKLRGVLDLETLLQTTVRELGLALDASEAVIQLGVATPSGGPDDDGRYGSREVLS